MDFISFQYEGGDSTKTPAARKRIASAEAILRGDRIQQKIPAATSPRNPPRDQDMTLPARKIARLPPNSVFSRPEVATESRKNAYGAAMFGTRQKSFSSARKAPMPRP